MVPLGLEQLSFRKERRMEGLGKLEKAVLAKLLDGDHPILAALRFQAENGKLVSQELTGVGFFCNFAIPPEIPPLPSRMNFELGDVHADIPGLKYKVGFILFVRDGYMNMLEGYTNGDDRWPDSVDSFDLAYDSEPRNVKAAKQWGQTPPNFRP